MRKFSLVSICGLLLATAACGSSSTGSNDPGGGEIRGQDDVQRFFSALMPDLVAVLTELANDPSLVPSALSSKTDKANGTSTVQCTDGGSISVDTTTGQATATVNPIPVGTQHGTHRRGAPVGARAEAPMIAPCASGSTPDQTMTPTPRRNARAQSILPAPA
jgi:hypothetical protein